MKGVVNILFILEEGFKDSLKKRMNQLKIVFNESEKFVWLLVLKVKKQELIELYSGVSSLLNRSIVCLEFLC